MARPDGMKQEVYEGQVVARTLRRELGLRDDDPVGCMVEIAEERLALDVVLAPLREDVSGFYVPTRPYPVVVVSNHHPVARQRFTLAHEVAHHALGHGAAPRIQAAPQGASGPTASPDVAVDTAGPPFASDALGRASLAAASSSRSPDAWFASPGPAPSSHYTPQPAPDANERAANAFAGELLVPDEGARRLVRQWSGDAPLDLCVRLSAHYGVSAFAATVKLEILGLLDRPSARALRETFRGHAHVARYDALGLPALDDALQRHRDLGGGIRCVPRARTALRRVLRELDAAS